MISNFDAFQKANQSGSELDNIRIKNYNIFKESDFPSKKQENWKYTDLRTILNNNFENLEIFKDKENLHYNSDLLIKNFERKSEFGDFQY